MAYTAIAEMREINRKRFGVDCGPMQPPLYRNPANGNDLKSAALRFLHDRCEELRFDDRAAEKERKTGTWSGRSSAGNQIPRNMQADLDRLTLEKSLEAFIDSGVAEDAYNVYYCFLEMFFGRYGKSKKMVELLSEFEANGSSLLMKHRDHYSHSVYVFALGLAIYETNEPYRRVFREFYARPEGNDRENDYANLYLEYWGLTALFHDIGYPFELPFEQVLSYFEVNNQKRGDGNLFMAYHDTDSMTALPEKIRNRLLELYGKEFHTTNELFAYDIAQKMGNLYGFTEGYILDVLKRKPTRPQDFSYFMDHAYFSANRLYYELAYTPAGDGAKEEEQIERMDVDALTAILMHNSLFKFCVVGFKSGHPKTPLPMDRHPLAWMLMLCDELQCWDRIAYGRNSRRELHPMAADFDFSDNRINATYYYDEEEKERILDFEKSYREWTEGGREGKPPRLKAYSDMAEQGRSFVGDIRQIVDTTDAPLTVRSGIRKADRSVKHTYLSRSNFLHIYDFAVALNGRYAHMGSEEAVSADQLEAEFGELSLEYKISNINQVKRFSRYLDVIGCFYTDRPVDYPIVYSFTLDQVNVFAPMEHGRWIREHQDMGWHAGDLYEKLPVPAGEDPEVWAKALREQMRLHKSMMEGNPSYEEVRKHYAGLEPIDQEKDWKPFNSMLKLIRKFDGLRIYRIDDEEE